MQSFGYLTSAQPVSHSVSNPHPAHPVYPSAGPPFRYVRNEEAEAADAAGAEALAALQLCGESDPVSAVQLQASPAQVPASPFAAVQQQQQQTQPQSQQPGVKRTLTAMSGKTSGFREAGSLGESLLDCGGDVTGNETATAQKAAPMRRRSSASSRPHSVNGADDAGSEPKTEKAELPAKCVQCSQCVRDYTHS